MKKTLDVWRGFLNEAEEEIFEVRMEVSFPNTRDIELETLYNLLRAIPAVTRVNAEKSQKKATNIYINLEIKINQYLFGTKSPMQYIKYVLIPNIYKYTKSAGADYRPNVILVLLAMCILRLCQRI